jgi:hypothetical protein
MLSAWHATDGTCFRAFGAQFGAQALPEGRKPLGQAVFEAPLPGFEPGFPD